MTTHVVTRDGDPISKVMTKNECFAWLLHYQPQSVDWACKYEGYAIVPAAAKEGP